MRTRINLAQNFLKDSKLAHALVSQANIDKNDLVYEIGAGSGVITEQLIKIAGRVVAFEADINLYNKLLSRFGNINSVEIRHADFLNAILPNSPYKVFSNPPFKITSSIINKLIFTSNAPQDTFLFVQKEAAFKFMASKFKNSQNAALVYPWFETNNEFNFERNDFFPQPSVDVVLLRIKKREVPLISTKLKDKYQDFVVYTFNQFKPNISEGLEGILENKDFVSLKKQFGISPRFKPSQLSLQNWADLFEYFENNVRDFNKRKIHGAYVKLKAQQEKLDKVHRTRLDKNWKDYK